MYKLQVDFYNINSLTHPRTSKQLLPVLAISIELMYSLNEANEEFAKKF